MKDIRIISYICLIFSLCRKRLFLAISFYDIFHCEYFTDKPYLSVNAGSYFFEVIIL